MPDTRWSLIARAEDGTTLVRHQALAELLQCYLPALQTHLVVEKAIPADQAHDLVQGFIVEKVLEQSIVAAANQARGRFRNLLLTALDNYVNDQYRQAHALKRSAGQAVPLETIETDLPSPPCAQAHFEAIWARQLLQRAIETMERQCRQMGRPEIWEIFGARILSPLFDDVNPLPYKELISQFGLESPAQASNMLMTAKRTFARILRDLIAEYESRDTVEEEIADLFRVLARCGAGSEPRARI